MAILHILTSAGTGGIENLCKDYSKFSNNDNIFLFVWNHGCVSEEMKKAGENVIEILLSKKKIFELYREILKVCDEKHIKTIVIHHDSPVIHLLCMKIHNKKKIRVVTYAHSNATDLNGGSSTKIKELKRFILKRSFRKADAVVAISESVKESLVDQFKVNSEKIHVIYNGVNVSKFEENQKRNERLEIIYVGRLIEQKGVQVTLKALSIVKDVIDYRFRIAGEGPYMDELKKLTKQLHIEDKVEFLGNRHDVPELLAASDIYIHMPVWQEGFGISVIEALAAGCICVCARSGAIPEIITDGKNGYLVDQNDDNHLSELLVYISKNNNSEVLAGVCENAKKRAVDFSIEKFSNSLDMLLK